MALTAIVNGYFRSGTTIFWEILKESNPDYTVFYEPCNNTLFDELENYRSHGEQDSLHGKKLWEEYFQFEGLIENLGATHPNIGSAFPRDNQALTRYVQNFNTLPGHVVLQTNRWHFSLEYLARRFRCEVIHIIRNPVDVYRSIQAASSREKSTLSRMILKPVEPLLRYRAFRSDQVFKEVQKRCGPAPGNGDFTRRMQIKFSAFEQHFISWLQTNFRAVTQLKRVGGLLVCYEVASHRPELVRESIERHGSLSVSRMDLLRERPGAEFLTQEQRAELDALAERSGLDEEWGVVKAAVEAGSA